MSTVLDVRRRTEAVLSRYITKAGSPEKYLEENFFRFLKDAYDKITDVVRTPRTSETQTTTTSQGYDLPDDIWDTFRGIIFVELDGKPIQRGYVRYLQEKYGEDWANPNEFDGVMEYVEYEDANKIYLVGPPTAGQSLKITYVQEVSEPLSNATAVPDEFKPFVNQIPHFIVGKILNNDKLGRGAAMLADFEGYLLKRKIRHKRENVRRVGRESYTQAFESYRARYGRRRKGT